MLSAAGEPESGGEGAAHSGASVSTTSTSHDRSSSSPQGTAKAPYPRPWIHREDALLLRLMAQYCDVKEERMKVGGWFRRLSKDYGVPGGPARDYDDILQRCKRLQKEFEKYDLIVENPRVWPTSEFKHFSSPLWDFSHIEAAQRYRAVWEDDPEEKRTHKDQVQAHKKPNEEAGEQSEATKGGNKKQVEKQSEVVCGSGAQTSSSSEQDEAAHGQQKGSSEDAESEAEISSSETSEGEDEEDEDAGVEDVSHASSSSQQQHHEDQHASKKQRLAKQNTRSRKRKRERTLLFESEGKRVRIGIPSKGTKVTFFPTNGSIEIIF